MNKALNVALFRDNGNAQVLCILHNSFLPLSIKYHCWSWCIWCTYFLLLFPWTDLLSFLQGFEHFLKLLKICSFVIAEDFWYISPHCKHRCYGVGLLLWHIKFWIDIVHKIYLIAVSLFLSLTITLYKRTIKKCTNIVIDKCRKFTRIMGLVKVVRTALTYLL